MAEEGTGLFTNAPKGTARDLYTRRGFGDVAVEIEFLIPQKSNSGVKMMGLYEIQITDSFGKAKLTGSDSGGIYPRAELLPKYRHLDEGIAPKTNACGKPGDWQKLEIAFRAARHQAELAEHEGRGADAIGWWQATLASDRSGIETLRRLAALHEAAGDPLSALRDVVKGLIYQADDKDLLERRDRYLWSIPLESPACTAEGLKGLVDPVHCVRKAKGILDDRRGDPEWLEVAEHLLALADRVDFLNPAHWDALATQSIFLSRDYLRVLEAHAPDNLEPRYALAYDEGRPVGAPRMNLGAGWVLAAGGQVLLHHLLAGILLP